MIDGIRTEFGEIGEGKPPYLIAEIGLNHNGSLDLARRSVDAAAKCGASGAKFQLYRSETFISADARLGDGSLREFFKQFELSENEWRELARHTREAGVDFFCSVFDGPSLEFHNELSAPLIKIASCDVNNVLLLKEVASTGLPVLLSTGTADEDEVAAAVSLLGASPLVLLQCVSSYPADPADYNLRVLPAFRERFDCLAGLSDHCLGDAVSLAAVALGACVVEKHFTLDRNLPGPDHALSADPEAFTELARDLRMVFDSLGDGRKRCVASERAARDGGRRSLHAGRDLTAGKALEAGDLLPLRPGGGISPDAGERLLGRVLKRDVAAGERLREEFFDV